MRNMIVEQRRGGVVEGRHPVEAVLCDAPGRVLETIGEDAIATFRSAAKPFQLEVTLPLVPEPLRAALGSEDLALGAASHHGEDVHVAGVASLLGRLQRTSEHLYCGVHPPAHHESMRALYARGELPSALHNNCSGKHAFMAAAALALGADSDYRAASHPLQRRIRARLDERTGGAIQQTVIDGCGIPCFVLPLSAMARAWAQLADQVRRNDGSVLARIGAAMCAHPVLMSGTEAFDGWLIQRANVIAKVGAQGLLCVAFLDQGMGAAIKIGSGADIARPAAAVALLSRWFPGIIDPSEADRFCAVTNAVGARVGDVRAVLS